MLQYISWYNFILYSFSVLGIYYSYVLLKYYRNDLRSMLSAKKRVTNKRLTKPLNDDARPGAEPEALEQLFGQAMILSEAIKAAFAENHFQEETVEELLLVLGKKIQEYPDLHNTAFRIAIRNLIESEAAKYQLEIKDAKSAIEKLWVRGDA